MKIHWTAEEVIIKEVSPRERIEERTGETIEYKVLKFGQKPHEKHSCVVFKKNLFQKLGLGLCCSLKGEVSFGPGSTYLVASHVESDGSSTLTAAPSKRQVFPDRQPAARS